MNSSNRLPMSLRQLLLAQLCLTLLAPIGLAQTAPAAPAADAARDAAAKPVPVVTTTGTGEANSGEVVELSPFQVVADNKGYYGGNTMSGTRFNSKIEDLASAITIVTKEQMTDLAMLDINDVFLYTAGTEGTGTYTDYVVDRNGSVADNVQLNPTGANRVRGIAPANVSLDNIETMNRVPIDPIMIDSLEISRGPNANVFGLGNPSGTVNQVAASANLFRDRTQVGLRVDGEGGYRDSLDFNKVLLKGKLALRFSQVFQQDEFQRKPSGVKTERYNGMIKYQPFKNTTISGSYSYYKMYGNRPNSLPPRDNMTYWAASGKPTWDPVTMMVHVNGTSLGPITATANFPTSFGGQVVDYFSTTSLGGNHNQMFIDQSGLVYWAAPQSTTNAVTPNANGTAQRYVQTTGAKGANGTAAKPADQPLFTTTPTISDKSIYDYENINISSVNRLMDRTLTSNITLDQTFFHNPLHTLVGQVTFMREDSQRYQRNLVGIANDLGQSGGLFIDVNERRLDGTPNPFFMRPYIGTDKPRTVWAPAKWDTTRGQLAYKIDFAEAKQDWMKYLGMHTVTGYGEYKYRVNRQYSFRDVITSANPWITPGVFRGNQSQVSGTPSLINQTQGLMRYYVGDNQGLNVDYAPTPFTYGDYNYVWGNSTTGVFHSEPSSLGLGASTDSTGGTLNTKTVLHTRGAVLQSHLFSDRLVVTYGLRRDSVDTLFGNTNTATFINADGITMNYQAVNTWESTPWRHNSGDTKNTQIVVRPFMNAKFLDPLGAKGKGGRFLADLLGGLSANYNKSDSFLPAVPAQDLFLHPLPNPTGEDKSWGVALNLFDGKLVVRATHFDDTQKNARNGDANTIAQRVIRTDLPLVAATPARFMLFNVAGATVPLSTNYNRVGWIKTQNPTWTDDQVATELYKVMGISKTLADALINPNPPIAATNDVISRGTEIEINYNPTKYWTVAASITENRSITANISSAVQQWINERMPIWTTLKDTTVAATAANPNQLWWDTIYPGASGSGLTANINYQAFVAAPFNVFKQLEGKSNPQIARYNFRVSSNLQLAGITDRPLMKKFSVGGAIRWQDKAAIGYQGIPDANGIYQSLDTNQPFYASAQYHFDAFVTYKTKLWHNKVNSTFQFNVRNIEESGGLRAVGAFPDGTISTYRIVDPRTFILQATFEM